MRRSGLTCPRGAGEPADCAEPEGKALTVTNYLMSTSYSQRPKKPAKTCIASFTHSRADWFLGFFSSESTSAPFS